MSHDQGRQKVSHKPARSAGGDETFARPSLFAQGPGIDEGHPRADTQRVHILATLESAQSPPRGASPRQRRQRRQTIEQLPASHGTWQMKALVGLMAAGILSLLTAFAMLLLDRDASPVSRLSPDASPTPQAAFDRRNPLSALVTHPTTAEQASPPLRPAAVIEDMPQAERLSVLAPTSLPASATAGNTATRDMPLVMATATATTTATGKPHARPRVRPTKDDDVALLEAVMAHATTRKAPPPQAPLSFVEAFQHCASLSGGAAATCRARICVQNPTEDACHQFP